jgi:hypothetical protein
LLVAGTLSGFPVGWERLLLEEGLPRSSLLRKEPPCLPTLPPAVLSVLRLMRGIFRPG